MMKKLSLTAAAVSLVSAAFVGTAGSASATSVPDSGWYLKYGFASLSACRPVQHQYVLMGMTRVGPCTYYWHVPGQTPTNVYIGFEYKS